MAVQWVSTWRLRDYNQRAAWLSLASEMKQVQEGHGAVVRHLAADYSGPGGNMTFIHVVESPTLAAHEEFIARLVADQHTPDLTPKLTAIAEIISNSLYRDAPLPA